ncbi:tyrosine-protein phosphatase non-receptor type substrate 1-like [Callorhinchus milii]|uniref:tyrosine-protein phosphatase non-receptor type substrate 1-like n=1 Tax=Callorhinchus milii TaxID=7868 RepID=UPI001C3FD3D4|nr:tyrosine-protein phosphatase non-receptor type substrate 1-like [Callorhinchus milii]
MMASDVISYICLIGIIATVPGDASMDVRQYPIATTALRGDNVKFTCWAVTDQQSSDITVFWWKRGESQYLNTKPDNRKIFNSQTFQLLNVTFRDSGVYLCAVIQLGKAVGNGTGSRLTVRVPPTPLKIFPRASERDSSKSLTLVCETAEFFPGDVTLTWYKNGNEVKTGINDTKEKNSKGLYKVSSSMEETQSVQNGVVYLCLVSHISLRVPAVVKFTVSNPSTALEAKDHYKWIAGGTAGGLVFLLLLIIVGKQCQLNKRKGSRSHQNRSGYCEEQTKRGVENEPVAYVALNLNNSKKTPRPKKQEERTVYAQTLQGAKNEPVTYAKVDLNHCKKTPRNNKQDERTVYAQTK